MPDCIAGDGIAEFDLGIVTNTRRLECCPPTYGASQICGWDISREITVFDIWYRRTTMNWKDAVRYAIVRYAARHHTVQIDRSTFIAEEQQDLVALTGTAGRTPGQTISRIFQELRDEGFLFFARSGRYVLNSKPLDAVKEDAGNDVLDNAVRKGQLILNDVEVTDAEGQRRLRRGVSALRKAALLNFGHACALCDIGESNLLVASHVARWADRPEARGQLRNVICFCRFHDSLFEHGYFALSDEFILLRKRDIRSRAIATWLDTCTGPFKVPSVAPAPEYLYEHRHRVGLSQ